MSRRYSAFQFVLSLNGKPVGGFSDVSGIGADIKPVRRLRQLTLKRGVLQLSAISEWVRGEEATLTLFDESERPVQTWAIRGALPAKYTGPTLAGRGGGDVAMEELVLSAESIDLA